MGLSEHAKVVVEFANAILISFVLKIRREFYCDCWIKY